MAEQRNTLRKGKLNNASRVMPKSAPVTSIADLYFDANADGLMLVTQDDGLIIKANAAAERLLGYAAGALIGLHFSRLLPPSTASERTSIAERFHDMAGVTEGQAFCRADGLEIPCDLLMTLMQDGQRTIAALNLRDVSTREARSARQHEAERLHAEFEASKEASRQRDQFISHLAHHLRTPLAVIHSSAGMVLRYHERLPIEKQLEHLLRIQTHARLSSTFIEDLRFINHADAGEITPDLAQYDLVDLTRRAIKPYDDHLKKPRIVFTSHADTLLANSDERLYIRLVDKLLSNAVLYSPVACALYVTLIEHPDTVTLTITDPGIGIPPDFLPVAYDAYQRGANIGDVDGMGMGLTVARACARLLGGDLTLDSQLGRGTTAKIYLPSSL